MDQKRKKVNKMAHQTAVKTGKRAEETVEAMLDRLGYVNIDTVASTKREAKEISSYGFYEHKFKQTIERLHDKIGSPFYSKQSMVNSSVYGISWCMDFVVHHPERFRGGLCIECKTQSVAGSVDEKYVFVEKSLLNVAKINGCQTLFYLGGGSIRPCVEWYLNNADDAYAEFTFIQTEADLMKFLGKGPSSRLIPKTPETLSLF